jgi:hypothetical protein
MTAKTPKIDCVSSMASRVAPATGCECAAVAASAASRKPRSWAAGPGRLLFAIGLGLLLLSIGNVNTTNLRAQEDDESAANREHKIKAAYLYQFGRYVDWPAKAFADSNAPFVIGVMEQDPLIPDLQEIAKIKKIQDRPIKIKRFSSAADVQACNILYLSDSLPAETQAEVIKRVAGKGVLLVGDSAGFIDGGGVARFAVEENRIRVIIARKAAEREGLTISAKLLQVARVVD